MQAYNVNPTSSKEDDNGGLGLCQQSMLINLENDFPSCADLTTCNLAPDTILDLYLFRDISFKTYKNLVFDLYT